MKPVIAAVLAALVSWRAAGASDVYVGARVFRGASVSRATHGCLEFRYKKETFTFPLAEVSRIVLDNGGEFNKAEDLFRAGRWEEAVAAYNRYILGKCDPRAQRIAILRRRIACARLGRPHETPPPDLSTPDSFYIFAPYAWPQTGLSPAEAEKEAKAHPERVKAWLALRVGKKVQWTLEVKDVRPPAEEPATTPGDWFPPGRITLVGRSEKGSPVWVTFPASRMKELAEYTPSQFVHVTGTVIDPPWLLPASFTIDRRIIVLDGEAIAPSQVYRDPFAVSADTRSAIYLVDARRAAARNATEAVKSVVRSALSLGTDQCYWVLFYGPRRIVSTPSTGPMKRSSACDDRLLADAEKFSATGDGDILPALQAVFPTKSFGSPPKGGSGVVVYLVAGADFADNQAVRKWIKTANARYGHQVHTICTRRDSPDLEAVLKQIAAENGGRFAYADGKGETAPDKPRK
ncbi:MAG TPA: hypothetical protein VM389_07265 [Phycisphaerae bacterium]|nr:hypothetical protein [Phycisphaerae bacterium]HUU22321.1 hypothetical protein [Phycisphaerae bacterium]